MRSSCIMTLEHKGSVKPDRHWRACDHGVDHQRRMKMWRPLFFFCMISMFALLIQSYEGRLGGISQADDHMGFPQQEEQQIDYYESTSLVAIESGCEPFDDDIDCHRRELTGDYVLPGANERNAVSPSLSSP